jgi:5-methylcytosine-specific restriction protein A
MSIKRLPLGSECACGCGERVTIVAPRPQARYISGHNRRGKRNKPWPIIVCVHCGEQKEVMPYLADRKFCSTLCRDDYRSARRGPDHPDYKARVKLICPTCGVEFELAPARARGGKRFCSPGCRKQARQLWMKEYWKSKRKPHCWTSGKRAAMTRDDGCCRICGFSVVVHVHHIKPRSEGGTHLIENMITLCPNHHAMVHAGLLDRRQLLASIEGLPVAVIVPRTTKQSHLFENL